ncbi:MAG TPA: hypothetical protein VH619_10140 [Verrucomicrobiae bacterium]|nr:hypothetical protein [Verrucomicrobiae bacterium]
MSICIAAIANDGSVFAVNDRMISTTDPTYTTYEPKVSKKVFQQTKFCIAMNAGHQGVQAEIMEAMQVKIQAAKAAGKEGIDFAVKDIVDYYLECYNKIKSQRLNNEVFAPVGLTQQEFIARQTELHDAFINRMCDEVYRFQFPHVATIVAGIDKVAGHIEPHIFSIKAGVSECCDASGYAAIGVGEGQVDAFLMQSQFTRHYSNVKVAWLCYVAKRQSEVCLGVGKQTDIRVIGPAGGVFVVGDPHLGYGEWDSIYTRMAGQQGEARVKAEEAMREVLKGKLPLTTSLYDAAGDAQKSIG